MDLARLLHDPRPFALLRRRTPGLDHDTVEVLIGPVTTCERLADLPDEGLALVPFRQMYQHHSGVNQVEGSGGQVVASHVVAAHFQPLARIEQITHQR